MQDKESSHFHQLAPRETSAVGFHPVIGSGIFCLDLLFVRQITRVNTAVAGRQGLKKKENITLKTTNQTNPS